MSKVVSDATVDRMVDACVIISAASQVPSVYGFEHLLSSASFADIVRDVLEAGIKFGAALVVDAYRSDALSFDEAWESILPSYVDILNQAKTQAEADIEAARAVGGVSR